MVFTDDFNNITKFYGIPGANAGKVNGMYKHGRWTKGIEEYVKKVGKCQICGSKTNLLAHHKNRDEKDNRISNIKVICKSCHEKLHKRGYNFTNKKSPMASKRRAPNGRNYH
jgi:hypothetical protein